MITVHSSPKKFMNLNRASFALDMGTWKLHRQPYAPASDISLQNLKQNLLYPHDGVLELI